MSKHAGHIRPTPEEGGKTKKVHRGLAFVATVLIVLGIGGIFAASASATTKKLVAAKPTATVTGMGDCSQSHNGTHYDAVSVKTVGSGLNPSTSYTTIVGDIATQTQSQYGTVNDGKPDGQGNLNHTGSATDLYGNAWDVGTQYLWLINGVGQGTFTMQAGNCGSSGSSTPPPPPSCTTNSKSVGSYTISGNTATVVLTKDLCYTVKGEGVGWDNKTPPNIWPQVNPTSVNGVVSIHKMGTYQLVAPNKCQVDFYANKNSAPKYPSQLNGPNNPYEPNFLDKYFNGPTPWHYNDCSAPPVHTIDIPATPSYTNPCGPNNATWNKPADTDALHWALDDNGHLVVTIVAPNTTFTDGTKTHDYGVAPDDNTPCPTDSTTPPASHPAQPTSSVKFQGCVVPGVRTEITTLVVNNTADATHQAATYTYTLSESKVLVKSGSFGSVADGKSASVTIKGLQPAYYTVSIKGSDSTNVSFSFTMQKCSTTPTSVPPSQVGPVPHTGFSGTVVQVVTHPYGWMKVPGGLLVVFGGLLGFVALYRREATQR